MPITILTLRTLRHSSSPPAQSCLGRRHGVGGEHGRQQVLDHLVLALLAGRLDLLDLGFGLAAGLLLGGLVSLRVLEVGVGCQFLSENSMQIERIPPGRRKDPPRLQSS